MAEQSVLSGVAAGGTVVVVVVVVGRSVGSRWKMGFLCRNNMITFSTQLFRILNINVSDIFHSNLGETETSGWSLERWGLGVWGIPMNM